MSSERSAEMQFLFTLPPQRWKELLCFLKYSPSWGQFTGPRVVMAPGWSSWLPWELWEAEREPCPWGLHWNIQGSVTACDHTQLYNGGDAQWEPRKTDEGEVWRKETQGLPSALQHFLSRRPHHTPDSGSHGKIQGAFPCSA